MLGLRRVKLTVNQDDIYHRHLFYADEKGTTGSAITFFEWPRLPPGQVGLGAPHHLSYSAQTLDVLPKWISWLTSKGVSVVGPLVRDERVSIYMRDPDGATVEITASNKEVASADYFEGVMRNLPTVTEVTRDMKLSTFNHASPITTDPDSTTKFFEKFVGLENKFTIPNPDQKNAAILAIGNDDRPGFLRYLVSSSAPDGLVGEGSIHHIAMAVEDDEAQRKILERMNEIGLQNSGIIDRFWFHSLYFRDPDGNLLEIATRNPGYAVDEPLEKLGSGLVLPKWLESRRAEVEAHLKSMDATNHRTWPPRYPLTSASPEALL
jgi:glyoxalase family protein